MSATPSYFPKTKLTIIVNHFVGYETKHGPYENAYSEYRKDLGGIEIRNNDTNFKMDFIPLEEGDLYEEEITTEESTFGDEGFSNINWYVEADDYDEITEVGEIPIEDDPHPDDGDEGIPVEDDPHPDNGDDIPIEDDPHPDDGDDDIPIENDPHPDKDTPIYGSPPASPPDEVGFPGDESGQEEEEGEDDYDYDWDLDWDDEEDDWDDEYDDDGLDGSS